MKFRRWLQVEFLLIFVAILARLVAGPRTVDDAYITYRYAQNLLSGQGLVYNTGEAVLGTTTPVYALVLAALGVLSGGASAPFPLLSIILNACADGLTCWILIKLGESLGSRNAGLAAALIWAIAPWSVTFAIGGMETSLFILLMASTFYLHSKDRLVGAALCASLTLLTRPDALLFILPLMIERIRRGFLSGKWNPLPLPVTPLEGIGFFLPLGIWIVMGLSAYGNPIPHSILAKVAAYRLPPEAGLIRLLQHYATPFLGHLLLGNAWIGIGLILFPVLHLLGSLDAIRTQPGAWPLLAYPWIYLAAFAIANPLIFRWYLTPPLPMYFMGIFLGSERIGRDLKSRLPTIILATFAFIATLSGWTIHPDHGPDRPAPKMAYIRLELLYKDVAERLQEQLQPGQTLAAGDIGALGYFTGARILDTIGLISPQSLPYYPIPEAQYVINYAIPPALILELHPDYLVTLEVYARNGLLRDPAFLASYDLIISLPTDIYGSEGMLVFRRGQVP